jgi:hypothetical protein
MDRADNIGRTNFSVIVVAFAPKDLQRHQEGGLCYN